MRAKTKTVLVLGAVIFTIGMIVWPGCATPPLPSIRKPISSRKKEDFAFPKSSPQSRSEIVSKVGEPDEYFPDLRVACYRINDA